MVIHPGCQPQGAPGRREVSDDVDDTERLEIRVLARGLDELAGDGLVPVDDRALAAGAAQPDEPDRRALGAAREEVDLVAVRLGPVRHADDIPGMEVCPGDVVQCGALGDPTS